jgi:hypothetical protein
MVTFSASSTAGGALTSGLAPPSAQTAKHENGSRLPLDIYLLPVADWRGLTEAWCGYLMRKGIVDKKVYWWSN